MIDLNDDKNTSRPRAGRVGLAAALGRGWDGDASAPSGEPKYGESIVSSWLLAQA